MLHVEEKHRFEAVATLRARGFGAVRLEDGVPEWRARGFEVTVGEKMR